MNIDDLKKLADKPMDDSVFKSTPMPTHIDSGLRCLVNHNDCCGQCMGCSQCGEWIRPRDFGGVCLGPK